MAKNLTTLVTSKSRTVEIQRNNPTVIIGERINPTGRKRLLKGTSKIWLLKQIQPWKVEIAAETILNEGLMPGMDHVGVEFKAGNLFVPEVLRSAKAMQEAMNIVRPILVETGSEPAGKIVLGTVKGDLHDIGKNLVGMMLEGSGFEVIDLGKDVDLTTFVEAVEKHQPDIIGMSVLLTTTMLSMERTIKALIEAGVRESVNVMIGGAPVTQDFADQIGADGYASNAASASDLAKELTA